MIDRTEVPKRFNTATGPINTRIFSALSKSRGGSRHFACCSALEIGIICTSDPHNLVWLNDPIRLHAYCKPIRRVARCLSSDWDPLGPEPIRSFRRSRAHLGGLLKYIYIRLHSIVTDYMVCYTHRSKDFMSDRSNHNPNPRQNITRKWLSIYKHRDNNARRNPSIYEA